MRRLHFRVENLAAAEECVDTIAIIPADVIQINGNFQLGALERAKVGDEFMKRAAIRPESKGFFHQRLVVDVLYDMAVGLGMIRRAM